MGWLPFLKRWISWDTMLLSQDGSVENKVNVKAKIASNCSQDNTCNTFFYYCVLHTNLMFIPPLKNSSMMVMTGFIRYLWPHMLRPLIICLALPRHGCQFPILMGSSVFLREYLENARSLNRYQAHPNLFTRTVT